MADVVYLSIYEWRLCIVFICSLMVSRRMAESHVTRGVNNQDFRIRDVERELPQMPYR